MEQVLDGTKALNQFDYEHISFQRKMLEEVVKFFKPFFQFLNYLMQTMFITCLLLCWILNSNHYELWKFWWDMGMQYDLLLTWFESCDPFFTTCFETLNPTIEACTSSSHGDEPKHEGNILGLEHLLKSFIKHLSLENYLCLGGYPYLLLHVKMLLVGGATMKGNLWMWHFWQKILLASQGHKLK